MDIEKLNESLTQDEATEIATIYCSGRFTYVYDDTAGTHKEYDIKCTVAQILNGQYLWLVQIYQLGKQNGKKMAQD